MKITSQISNPQDVEITITTTATAEQWEKMLSVLKAGTFSALAGQMIQSVGEVLFDLKQKVKIETTTP